MSAPDAQPLRWEDGVPVSERYDDPYFSRADGYAETRHVFLAGCDLPRRWLNRTDFTIAELGFGTGLNFCAALRLWRDTAAPGARLNFVSFERYPLTRGEIATALSRWEALHVEREALLGCWDQAGGAWMLGNATLQVVIGDARKELPHWAGTADAWFLDGFAPARNPELWEVPLMRAVARHSAKDATLATYSAAGSVRRALTEAGFEVRKSPGYGRKRDMVAARRAGDSEFDEFERDD